MNSDSPNTADIVERLNAYDHTRPSDVPSARGTRTVYPLINPDGPEAAAIITELREALAPFAKLAEPYGGNQDIFELTLPRGPFFGKDDWPGSIRVGDLRKARAALKDHRKAQAHD